MRVNSSVVYQSLQDVRSLVESTISVSKERFEGLSWNDLNDRANIKDTLRVITKVYERELSDIIYNGVAQGVSSSLSNTLVQRINKDLLLERVVSKLESSFHKHSLNYRIKRVSRIITKTGELLISNDYDLETQWLGSKNLVKFGSLYKQSLRLTVSEIYRANQIAAVEVAKMLGISKVRWELDVSHHIYDVCDLLVGEYDLVDVPDYPHPYCKCHIVLVE